MFANKAREFLFTNNHRTRRPHRAQCLTVLQRNRSRSASLPTCFRTRTVSNIPKTAAVVQPVFPEDTFSYRSNGNTVLRVFSAPWSVRIRASGWMFEC
ncbi:hypothetical protein TNCT_715601 [Trichonephila clavata]|uniref:Uncharacterized protein n=1 Tax=Trichonephila clavata TaxID=2740835 RepID=A0A8X6J9U7_TRICU|nr:hypothetical protein TNCT_570581 [Trichonephila clavata]GFR26670.1 hypothetical protein TNCT_715601 [Trichonephila clavata]